MAITRTGDWTNYGSGSPVTESRVDASISVTVPDDAEAIVVCVHGWNNSVAPFTGGSMSLGGVTCALEIAGDTSTTAFQGAMFVGDVRGKTGTQTLAWDLLPATAINNGIRLAYAFYKGADMSGEALANLARDSYGTQGATSTPSTDTMTAASGDLIVAWSWQYAESTLAPTSWTATPAATGNYTTPYEGGVGSWAEYAPSGNTQITCTWTTSEGGIAAIVLKSAGGGSTPSGIFGGSIFHSLIVR